MKLAGLQEHIIDVNFKLIQTSEASGYAATKHHENWKKAIKLHSGSLHIEMDATVLESNEILYDEDSVASQIWEELRLIFNKAVDNMVT